MAQALGAFGVDILYHVAPRSLVIGYALGVLLTLVVVAVSAWRVSVLNITTAVRNLPEPPRRRRAPTVDRRRRRAGRRRRPDRVRNLAKTVAMPFMLGSPWPSSPSSRLARAIGVPDRMALRRVA